MGISVAVGAFAREWRDHFVFLLGDACRGEMGAPRLSESLSVSMAVSVSVFS